ncbi:hypothetical protein D3C81_1650020 [compost metagenome]
MRQIDNAGWAMGNSRDKVKLLPRPNSLTRSICPPINCASLLQTDRPRPVPPNRREMEVSACIKGSNNMSCWALAIPIPESATCSLIA